MNLIDQPITPVTFSRPTHNSCHKSTPAINLAAQNTVRIMMMWVTVIGPNLSVRYGWNVPYNVVTALTDHIDIYKGEYDRRSDDIHASFVTDVSSEA